MQSNSLQANSLQANRPRAPKLRFLGGLVNSEREPRRARRHRKARAYARLFLLAAHLSSPTPAAAQNSHQVHDRSCVVSLSDTVKHGPL